MWLDKKKKNVHPFCSQKSTQVRYYIKENILVNLSILSVAELGMMC